ncbi:MAG: PA3496 family putative envelope integrity protein [Thalassotalea sp.]
MSYDDNDNAIVNESTENIDDVDDIDEEEEEEIECDEQSKRNSLARKRIDDLLEQKRLKELLDDEEDWEV